MGGRAADRPRHRTGYTFENGDSLAWSTGRHRLGLDRHRLRLRRAAQRRRLRLLRRRRRRRGQGNIARLTDFKAGELSSQGAPDTTISSGPTGVVVPNVSFSFEASESGAAFECALDGASFGECASPKTYAGLPEGAHTFKVRATPGPAGWTKLRPSAKLRGCRSRARRRSRPRSETISSGAKSRSRYRQVVEDRVGERDRRGVAGVLPRLRVQRWPVRCLLEPQDTSATAKKPPCSSRASWALAPRQPDSTCRSGWTCPSPENERTGYEARFTGGRQLDHYAVQLSKWVSGSRTALACTAGFSLPVDAVVAFGDAGGALRSGPAPAGLRWRSARTTRPTTAATRAWR